MWGQVSCVWPDQPKKVSARPYDERVLIAIARPVESQSFDVQGHSLEEINEAVAAKTPEGWELTSARVALVKGSTLLNSTAVIARRDGLIEIEAANLDGLRAKLPDGYELLFARKA